MLASAPYRVKTDKQTHPPIFSLHIHTVSSLLSLDLQSKSRPSYRSQGRKMQVQAANLFLPVADQTQKTAASICPFSCLHCCCYWVSISFQLLRRQEEAPAIWCFKGEFSCSMLMKTKSIAIKNHLVRFNYRI